MPIYENGTATAAITYTNGTYTDGLNGGWTTTTATTGPLRPLEPNESITISSDDVPIWTEELPYSPRIAVSNVSNHAFSHDTGVEDCKKLILHTSFGDIELKIKNPQVKVEERIHDIDVINSDWRMPITTERTFVIEADVTDAEQEASERSKLMQLVEEILNK